MLLICSNPTATIFQSYEGIDSSAPYIAPFSSRGPNKITPNILKVNFIVQYTINPTNSRSFAYI